MVAKTNKKISLLTQITLFLWAVTIGVCLIGMLAVYSFKDKIENWSLSEVSLGIGIFALTYMFFGYFRTLNRRLVDGV